MEDLFRVGCIAKAHGVHGEVKVYPTTDEPERFLQYGEVLLENKKTRQTMHIEAVKFLKNMVIVKFTECRTMEDAELLRGAELYVTRKQAVPLGENEYYISDLIGIRVVSDQGTALGVLDDVMQTGANDVYVVKREDGRELLLPAIRDCVKTIDIAGRQMTVHLMPGLADDIE